LAALALPLLAAVGWQCLIEASERRRPGWLRLRLAIAWLLPLIVAIDLVHAHRPLILTLPVHQVLARTQVIDALAANTHADGPRVHSTGLTRDLLEERARLIGAGDTLAMVRQRVELLEGGLPIVFGVHSTWGAAAVTPRERSELLERARGPAARELADELRAGFLVTRAGSHLPLPQVPADGGAAELYLLPWTEPAIGRTWRGPNRAVGSEGLEPPSQYPGWREAPLGTWSFRPRYEPLFALLSLLGLGALGTMALRRPPVDRTGDAA